MHRYDDSIWNIGLQAVMRWLDIDHTNSGKSPFDDKELRESVEKLAIGKEIESADGQVDSFFLLELAKHLYLEQKMNGGAYHEAYKALWQIWAHIGNIYVFPITQDVILKLLDYGRCCSGSTEDFAKYDKGLQRMIVAGKYLETIFGKIPIKNGEFDTSELDIKVFDRLNHNVSIIGGMIFLEYLINRYLRSNGNYMPRLDRYILMRQDEKNGNFPLQLLLNLSGKYLENNIRRNDIYNKIYTVPLRKETVQIAKNYLDVCKLYGKSGIEYAMMHREDYTCYTLDEQMYEKMCLPMQYSCRYVLGALKAMVEPFWSKLDKKYRFKDYCKFIEAGYQSSGGIFTVTQIATASGLPVYKTKAILADVAISASQINRKFLSFVSEANFLISPLICMPNNVYLLVDSHFTGIGYYLIMQEHLASAGIEGLGFNQGHNLECWLQDEMKKHGIDYKSGAYPAKGGRPEGECDVVLEEQGIYFIELKKQSIMREFNHIDDVALYSALGKGMVHAQAQAFGHELYWRTNKGIELTDGKLVAYDENNPVYKISVCFSDYAFLSSKAFTRILMDSMFSSKICAVDTSRQGELNKFNKYAASLQDNLREQNRLLGRDKVELQELISPVVFCSLQQILTAIWCMEDAPRFYDILKEWICRSDANLDLYVTILVKLYEKEHPENKNIVVKSMVEKAIARKVPWTIVS